jgi:5-methylcytosine-specific restriction endonuclease McrA
VEAVTRRATKNQRIDLYLASGGRCRQCGVVLGRSFHADHVTPFRISKDTNIHDMQALCPRCNLRKGGKDVSEVPIRV